MIQNSDYNISHASYRHLKADELLVTKIFYTIQGEGPFAGYPSVFIRLAGCNRGDKSTMGCEFCDTDFRFDQGQRMTFSHIEGQMLSELNLICQSGADHPPLFVITGGEPMMQDNVVGLIEYLGKHGWEHSQIESNGDRLASGFLENRYCITSELVVSPKVTRGRYHALKPDVLHRANALKYVISSDPASPYHFPGDFSGLKEPEQIFISPMTVYRRAVIAGEVVNAWDLGLIDHPATMRNYQWAAKLAMQQGYRLSMQQHLFFSVE